MRIIRLQVRLGAWEYLKMSIVYVFGWSVWSIGVCVCVYDIQFMYSVDVADHTKVPSQQQQQQKANERHRKKSRLVYFNILFTRTFCRFVQPAHSTHAISNVAWHDMCVCADEDDDDRIQIQCD